LEIPTLRVLESESLPVIGSITRGGAIYTSPHFMGFMNEPQFRTSPE